MEGAEDEKKQTVDMWKRGEQGDGMEGENKGGRAVVEGKSFILQPR